jgi:hypothetical protein
MPRFRPSGFFALFAVISATYRLALTAKRPKPLQLKDLTIGTEPHLGQTVRLWNQTESLAQDSAR